MKPVLLLLLIATAARAATNELRWPPPPNPARIAYRQQLTGPADLGIRPSFWGRLFGFFTGETHRDLLAKPFGVALDETGNLLLTDTGARSLFWFDRGRHRCQRWTQIGPYRLASPVAVACRDGICYIADSELPAVLACDTTGQLRWAITTGLERPAGLALAGDKLCVADAGAHGIAVFDLRGQPLTRFGRRGTAPGEFNFPTHLAADATGRLFITDSLNCRVQICSHTGAPLSVIGSRGDGSGHLSRPKGIAVDSAGHVYVVDALFDNVQIFDHTGRLLLHFGEHGSQPGQFWLPSGLAIGRDDRIYVADTYNHRVQIFQYLEAP